MLYEELSLFNYVNPYYEQDKVEIEALPINSISDMVNIINLCLRQYNDSLFKKMMDKIVKQLKNLEYKILEDKGYSKDLVLRSIEYKGFHKSKRSYGECRLSYINQHAVVTLGKNLIIKDNGKGILNVLAHEVLHGILPYREMHGCIFKNTMNMLNRELHLEMRVTGINGKAKPNHLYELYCPKCNKVYIKHYRMCDEVRMPEMYECKCCRQRLKSRKRI